MFHLYISLAYIIPNIYVFFRIMHLFIPARHRLTYIAFYMLMFSVYPFTESYSGQETGLFIQLLSIISGYILPFYLYLFLFLLLYEVFLVFNHWFGIFPYKKRQENSYRLFALSSLAGLSIAVVTAGAVNLNTIRVSEYRITVPRKNSTIDHLRVTFAADFHIQQTTGPRFVRQFVNKVNALHPDIVLYGGDIVDGHDTDEASGTIIGTLKKVNAKYGAFGVYGNHEFHREEGQNDFYRRAGIILLQDTVINIDNAFYLAGRNDLHFRNRKTIDELLKKVISDKPVLLIDHRPVGLKEVGHTITDAQFSGHTHNGQLFPINLVTNRIYELSRGYWKIGNTHFFVTSGLRLWGPPVKTAGKSEIMLVDIDFK